MGRMVLEAEKLDCVDEAIVLAAALSIQDPRERPAEQQAQADQSHARFADPGSDFLALVNLWRYVRDQQRELSANQFRKRIKGEFIHYLRVREWQDLAGQLRQSAKGLGMKINHAPAEPDDIHRAVLSGLLSHVGLRDAARRDYVGARNARFALWPGSGVKGSPAWVMAAELVETSRLWGRAVARIDPKWIEPLAEHLVRRSYDEPRWDRKRAQVVATERVTLYGLPVVAGRTVGYGRIDPRLSRELFVRRALVEGEWDAHHRFLEANRALVEEVRELEDRARRRDILVGDEAIFAFYAARIPAGIVSGTHFDRWWRDERRRRPELLHFTRELLVNPDAAGSIEGRPGAWRQGDLTLPLSYRFDPGSAHDGVTVHVPLKLLPQLRAHGFEWLVPAFRAELVIALIRSLPKELRKRLVPVPDAAAGVLERLEPRRKPLLEALAEQIELQRGVRIPPDAWDLSRLPSHLRMTFSVEDDSGEVLATGQDLDALREQVRPRLRAALAAATRSLERTGLTEWTIGDLPRIVALPGTGQAVRAYPALVDEGETVGVRALETPEAQARAMYVGTRRLLALASPSPLRCISQSRLSSREQLALAAAPHGSLRAALEDCVTAAVAALMAEAGGPVFDAAGFRRLRDHVAGSLAETTLSAVKQMAAILDAAAAVRRRLDALPGPAFADARRDVAQQLGRLVFAGFVTASGLPRLGDIERYLRAAERRLERLPDSVSVDRDRMRAVHELEDAYRRRLDALPRGAAVTGPLAEVPWMLEELRVHHFAQSLGTRPGVSNKRVRQVLAESAR
jgi:ATP-dependent helicase HrpA